jgi:hypothetical protein
LSAIAPQSNLLVAEFRGSTCATIHGRNETSTCLVNSPGRCNSGTPVGQTRLC